MTGHGAPGAAAGFGAAAAAYDATGTEFFAWLGRALVDAAGIQTGAVVLDIGCGKGAATLPAARAAGSGGQVTGLDGSPEMLALAEMAARQAGLGWIRWRQGDAEDPMLGSGSQDVVLASSVIQFLRLPQRAVRNWLGLLRPGGTLAVSWGLAQDPAWLPVMGVFDAAVPAPRPGFETYLRRDPFGSAEAMNAFLAGCGYDSVVTSVQPVTSTYTGPDQWWQACQSQAPYIMSWQHIPGDRLEAARREAFRLLESMRMRDPERMLRRTLQFGLTTACRPRTSAG